MHELSVATDMLKIIEEDLGGKQELACVRVTLGPLAGICAESLTFCFTEVAEQEGFGRPTLAITEVPARARCAACSKEYDLAADLLMLCPECESPARKILSGQEFTLDSVECEET